MELMRLSNNIQFYKHKIALCQASNARIFYEKLLAKEAKRFQVLQLEYQRLDLRSQQVTYQETQLEESDNPEEMNPEDIIQPEQTDQPTQDEIDTEPVEPTQPAPPTQEGTETIPNEQRVFTEEELSKYNGTDGQPAYVAVNGIVYDVSEVKRWVGGKHFSMVAGKNLTMNFNVCHGGNIEVIKNLPKVGILSEKKS
jgi:predicted heme/steroid binding protein